MLHLKSISTIPIPPWKSIILSDTLRITSLELVTVRAGVEYSEALLSASRKTALVLVEREVDNLVGAGFALAGYCDLLADSLCLLVVSLFLVVSHS